MADRPCRNFQPNIFNKIKCQNCFKLQEAHRTSQTIADPKGLAGFASSVNAAVPPPTTSIKANRAKTIVKSGVLAIFIQESCTDKAKTHENKWNRRWIVLNSTGVVDYFVYDELNNCFTDIHVGKLHLDDCTNLFVGEVDTGEPFSLGLNTPDSTHYFKADNRLEMDNWTRVFRPFVQAARAYPRQRGSRNSVGSIEGIMAPTLVSSSNLSRGSSFGKSSVGRPMTPPRTSSTHPKTRFTQRDSDLQPAVESFKMELEKLREENKKYKEKQTLNTKQRESLHILEQELKSKTNRIKELEKEYSKCKDYQKAVIFQEQELQDLRFTMKDLRRQLEESEKMSKQLKLKLSFHGKELAEAKADIDEANSIISIHKANIESLKSELSSVKHVAGERRGRVILTDEEPESDRIFSFEANGDDGQKKDIETKLAFLVQKLKQNERELLIKTKELEKANESRSKVAKYTRSLLQELETKLSNNERKLAETEHQLKNSDIELEYEQEQRAKLEREKERLTGELERLIDLNKKARLPKDAVALMKEAKADKSSDQTKTKLLEKEEKLKKVESEFAVREKELLDTIQSLTTNLTSLETVANKSEKKYKENEKSLKTAYGELEKARKAISEQSEKSDVYENVLKLKKIISMKEKELQNTSKTVDGLENELAVFNRKNQELENKLDSMDEKLCQSLEKQFSLTEENEKCSKEKTNLERKIVSLEEKLCDSKEEISTLKMALSESICENDSNVEVEQQKIRELEKNLSERNKEIDKVRSVVVEREKELGELKLQRESNELKSKDVEDGKRKVEELEKEMEELNTKTKEMLKAKDVELVALRDEKERLERELALIEVSKKESKLEDVCVAELEEKISQYETYLGAAKETILEYENQINELNSQERENELKQKEKEFENTIDSLDKQLGEYREKLAIAEEKLLDYDVEEKLLSAELQKCKKDEFTQENVISITNVQELENEPTNSGDKKDSDYEKLLAESTSKLISSEKKVVELAEELEKRLKLEQQTSEWMEGVEASLGRTEGDLVNTKSTLLAKSQELEREKCNVLDLVDLSRNYIKELESSLAVEKTKVEELENKLQQCVGNADSTDGVGSGTGKAEMTPRQFTTDSPDGLRDRSWSFREIAEKLAASEREKDNYKSKVSELTKDLEETKQQLNERLESAERSHQKDMNKINEDTLKVSGAAKTEGDELRLRLTSRVITLQSDISELKAAHQTVIEKLKARHKKGLENARREAILEYSMKQPIMESSEEMNASVIEMEAEMKDMVTRYENQMEFLKQSHQREMERIKRSSDHGEGLQTEVAQLQAEMEEMGQKYMEEIEVMKVKHAEELDQLKKDMSVVIQASMGGNYSPSKDANESNTQQLKSRVTELEVEIDELNQKYNEELRIERESQQKELDQIRDDMMTVIQAVKSQQYDLDPDTEQLQRTVREQEAEIKRLKEEQSGGGLSNEKISKLEKLEKANSLLTEEKEEIEKSLKRQEAATMFGLRRTEEMSNKIYQMQKEMEDIDRKYMKEINVYKEAYEREKEIKSSGGDVSDGDAGALIEENEELTLELEELKLKMEENETLHDNELKRYKERLAQEKLLDVNDLRLQIKGLEDGIEEVKLEHKREIEELQESHEKNMKSLNVEHDREIKNIKKESLSSTTTGSKNTLQACEEHKYKIRTLDFKIEELESLLEVKKRRHKQEVRTLKERLDEEIERHGEDVRIYETKLKDCDGNRRGSFTSAGPGASEYFRKQLAELRAENRGLKDEMELLRERKASSIEKPLKDTKRQTSEPEIESLSLKDSKKSRQPLRKTSSDSKAPEIDASKRSFRLPAYTGNETTEKPAAKPLTRQSSKNEVKSVAARVAMFQTPKPTTGRRGLSSFRDRWGL